MHNMGIAFNGVQLFYLDGAESAYFAQVVPSQIHQHIMFGKLLFIFKQFCLQFFIFFFCSASGAGSCQGEGMQYAVL